MSRIAEGQSREDWADRLAESFGRIVERPPSERSDLLEELGSIDSRLGAEVATLLRAHEASAGAYEAIDSQWLTRLLEDDEGQATPDRAGPYRILEEIGRGGMGTVYLAERVEGGFEQRVAVKVLKRGMDSDAVVSRFLAERQILAGLDHPRIARLLDGGVVEDGRPYFALELVDGESLIAWCDARRWPVRARLELFEKVCRTVQSAHARLVVHRDLKPANILVESDGEPKLLDFGIAKVLTEGAVVGEPTLGNLRVMTPEYAAPEQIRSEPVTVATDVYALGVILFELLTGRHPYASQITNWAELEEVVCRKERQAASSVRDDEAWSLAAKARSTRPERLRRVIRGDLDRIVLEALAKDPRDRYPSVEALADDIRAYLDGMPIKARSHTFAYRGWRFVDRHRIGSLVTLGVAIALTTSLALAVHQGQRAERERDRARRVQEFLVDLFEASDPNESKGEEATARELLKRGEERLDDELVDQPETQVELLGVIGRVYLRLGQYDRAEELLARGVALARVHTAGDTPRLAELLRLYGETLTAAGRYDQGQIQLEESVRLMTARFGSKSLEAAASLDALAINYHYRGDLDSAEELYSRAYAVYRSISGESHETTLATLNNLANLASDRGRFGEAIERHEEILGLILPLFGENHPEIAVSLNNLGMALRRSGRFAEALRVFRRSHGIREVIYDEGHPSFGTTLNNIGVTQRSLGQYAEAEQVFGQLLATDRSALGREHPYVGFSLDNLASVVAEQGRSSEAHALLDEAAAIHRIAAGEDSPRYASHLFLRARAFEISGDYALASEIMERCLGIRASHLGETNYRTVEAIAALARLRHRLQGDKASVESYRAALELQEATLPKDHPDLVPTFLGLGRALLTEDRVLEAEGMARRGLSIAQIAFPADSWQLEPSRSLLGAATCARGELEEGSPLTEKAVAALARALGVNHPDSGDARALARYCGSV